MCYPYSVRHTPMARKNSEIITFKAEPALVEAMRGVPNRSEFIRAAVLAALGRSCPLCAGTGTLSPRQWEHWEQFAAHHTARECPECHEVHLVCEQEETDEAHPEAPEPERTSP